MGFGRIAERNNPESQDTYRPGWPDGEEQDIQKASGPGNKQHFAYLSEIVSASFDCILVFGQIMDFHYNHLRELQQRLLAVDYSYVKKNSAGYTSSLGL